jgi:glutaminase
VTELSRLLALGADADRPDYDGRTALHLAVTERHVPAAQVLLQEGARSDRRDRWGLTPADYATSIGAPDLVRLLLQAAGQQQQQQQPPPHRA